jgi:tetratricopeptide (TPR) repeat protein
MKAHYGDNDFKLASTCGNIGSIYIEVGNLKQALEMYMKQLNIKKAHYGDNNFNLASTYGNIGSVYR